MQIKVGRGLSGHPYAVRGEETPNIHATVRLRDIWWQYRVFAPYREHGQLKLWRVSRGVTIEGRTSWTGFVPSLEGEVPDTIKDALIREMMAARLSNSV